MRKITFFKTLLVAAGLLVGECAWAEDQVVNIPIAASYNMCGANNYESRTITQLYINSASGSYGEAQIKFLLDENFDASKVKSATLELYTISKSARTENVNISAIGGFNANLSRKTATEQSASEDGNAKIFSYGANSTRSYGFSTPTTSLGGISLSSFTANAYTSVDITTYIQGLTSASPGDAIYFGIAATDAKPLDLELAGYQHTNASKLVITYTTDAMYEYSIKAVNGGTVLKTYTSGSCTKGETFSAILNEVLKGDDGKYYVLGKSQPGVTGYTASFTMGEDDGAKEVAYTLDETIEYFAEGETFYSKQAGDVEGCSGGKNTAYMQSVANATESLSGGTYQMEVYVTGRFGSNPLNVYDASGTNILATTGKGNSTFTGIKETEEFKVAAGGTVKVGLTNGNSLAFDYFIIRKKSDDATVSKTITAAGWATYCSPYALDFSSPIANLTKAYIVTGATGATLTLSEIDGTIPAYTGILLEGEGAVKIPVAISSATDVSANKLAGVTADTKKDANSIYVLMNENDVVGFYKNNKDFTVGANTAYLNVADFAEAPVRLVFSDEATAINDINAAKAENEAIYNVAGQRVTGSYKGIVIKNSKKYLSK